MLHRKSDERTRQRRTSREPGTTAAAAHPVPHMPTQESADLCKSRGLGVNNRSSSSHPSAVDTHLVGEAPEQHGHHHGTPQLSHHVEQAEGPVAQDSNGAGKAGASLLQQVLTEGCSTAAAVEQLRKVSVAITSANRQRLHNMQQLCTTQSRDSLQHHQQRTFKII